MNLRTGAAVILGVIIISSIVFTGIFLLNPPGDGDLTIYTYESLLADPGYDFETAFEEYAGLDPENVRVVRFSDAGTLLARAISEKDSPVADVIIGLDNILIHTAREENLFVPYESTNADAIIPSLVADLAPDFYMTPYDYGVISLWGFEDAISAIVNPETFGLLDIPGMFAESLIVPDARLSSPGLAFMLHTIAVFGDGISGIEGLIDGDWRNFWGVIADDIVITPSWGDAFGVLGTGNRTSMVSYSTSPAYNLCLFNDSSTVALLTHEDDGNWGWGQIEGLGIVNGASDIGLARDFVDWFISPELQSQIYLNQWIYPARADVTVPDCYGDTLAYNDIDLLNSQISLDLIEEHLDTWLDQWEIAIATG